MTAQLHIVSVVVHHRPESTAALDAALARLPDTELALRAPGRSVVLCEGEDEAAVVAGIESLREIPGVLGVSLVHHHAETRESLYEELPDGYPP